MACRFFAQQQSHPRFAANVNSAKGGVQLKPAAGSEIKRKDLSCPVCRIGLLIISGKPCAYEQRRVCPDGTWPPAVMVNLGVSNLQCILHQ